MQDGIIKGSGNSRYLKSISTFLQQYPTYQEFVAALVAGTLPIDLNGINETGWNQLGTALNKENLLSDETCEFLGIPNTATPDDALQKLFELFYMLQTETGFLKVTVNLQNGTAVPNVCVDGIISRDGSPVYTDLNGVASGFAHAGSVHIQVVDTLDILSPSTEVSVEVGGRYEETITATERNTVTIDSSGNWKISGLSNQLAIDVTAVGGGGGGFIGTLNSYVGGGGGGGGYVATAIGILLSQSDVVSVVIGSGGAAASGGIGSAAGSGGTTTVLKNDNEIISASGGSGGSLSSSTSGIGGSGNGNGGNTDLDGGDGFGYIWNDSSQGLAGGGGGGGGSPSTASSVGGSPNGADSGYFYDASRCGTATSAGYGGGGGGGIHDSRAAPSNGGPGVVYIRINR